MPFIPHSEHAIQSASFSIHLDRPLPWKVVETLGRTPLDWRRELPALEVAQMVDVQINAAGGPPQGRVLRGLEFSHKRPDGSSEWELAVIASEIRVETIAYTRWAAVWAKAGDLLINAAGHLSTAEAASQFKVIGISLAVVDSFHTTDTSPDYSSLFAASDALPAAVFNRGPLWHAHSGWFDDRPEGSVLNQLNVDVRKNTDSLDALGRTDATIQHNQTFRPRNTISLNDSKSVEKFTFEEIPLMHEANKSVVRSLLTKNVRDQIKIDQ